MIKIKTKKIYNDAKIPEKAYKSDAGWDMWAISKLETPYYIEFGTGIAFNIPNGYVGELYPRSSITKKDLMLKNSVGIIDSGYLGEIKFRFYKTNDECNSYEIGDKIGQIIFKKLPDISLVAVDSFKETTLRGEKGFGSSGNK